MCLRESVCIQRDRPKCALFVTLDRPDSRAVIDHCPYRHATPLPRGPLLTGRGALRRHYFWPWIMASVDTFLTLVEAFSMLMFSFS